MILKFLSGEEYSPISSDFSITSNSIEFNDPDIPMIEGGFTLIMNEGTGYEIYERMFEDYKMVEKINNKTVFSRDNNTYFVYYKLEPETKYVTDIFNSLTELDSNVLFKEKGKGLKYANPTADLYDEDGVYRFKCVNDELVPLTSRERQIVLSKREAEHFQWEKDYLVRSLSAICESKITEGVEFNGEHFSYTTADQSNISNAVTLAQQTGLNIPYHSDGNSCRLFTKEEIFGIYVANELNVTHHTTYFNQLKLYIQNEVHTQEELDAVQYGMELTGDYKSTYDMVMLQANEVIKSLV